MGTQGNKYYGILTFVSAGSTAVSKAQMIRGYGEQLTDEVIALGAVRKVSKSDDSNPTYAITDLGRKLRDQ